MSDAGETVIASGDRVVVGLPAGAGRLAPGGRRMDPNKSLGKAIALLSHIAARPDGATVTELAAAAGTSRPTASRLLWTLEQHGMLDRANDQYSLGWRLAALGRAADPYRALVLRSRPILRGLADKLGESITLGVTNEPGFDTVAQADAPRAVGATTEWWVGRPIPLHATAFGKLVLAELPDDRLDERLPFELERLASNTITSRRRLHEELMRVRAEQSAITEHELEEGFVSIAVPLRDDADGLLAMLGASGPHYRFDRAAALAALPALRVGAQRLLRAFLPAAANGEEAADGA